MAKHKQILQYVYSRPLWSFVTRSIAPSLSPSLQAPPIYNIDRPLKRIALLRNECRGKITLIEAE